MGFSAAKLPTKPTKKSREHTSRLMKKLFESGLVERNTETKPYTYSITEKGKSLSGIGVIEQLFVGPHKISGLNGLFDGAI